MTYFKSTLGSEGQRFHVWRIVLREYLVDCTRGVANDRTHGARHDDSSDASHLPGHLQDT